MSGTAWRDDRLKLGRVVSLSFGAIGRNIVPIGLLTFVAAALTVGLGLWAKAELATGLPSDRATGAGTAAELVISFVLGCFATAGITQIVVADVGGERIGTVRAFAAGLRRAFPLLGLNIVVGLGLGLGIVLLVVPGIMLAIRWGVAAPVRVIEGLSINNSLRRSTELTKGNRWRLFGLLAIVVTLVVVVAFVFVIVEMLLARSGLSQSVLVVRGATDVVLNMILTSLIEAIPAVCYAELRRIREGATPGQVAAVFA